jgi:hypothetical protein
MCVAVWLSHVLIFITSALIVLSSSLQSLHTVAVKKNKASQSRKTRLRGIGARLRSEADLKVPRGLELGISGGGTGRIRGSLRDRSTRLEPVGIWTLDAGLGI